MSCRQHLREHSDTLRKLGQIYKQINAPFGELAEITLKVSTYALTSDSPGDAIYNNLENQIASWTSQRDGLTAQIKSMLEGAEFNGDDQRGASEAHHQRKVRRSSIKRATAISSSKVRQVEGTAFTERQPGREAHGMHFPAFLLGARACGTGFSATGF